MQKSKNLQCVSIKCNQILQIKLTTIIQYTSWHCSSSLLITKHRVNRLQHLLQLEHRDFLVKMTSVLSCVPVDLQETANGSFTALDECVLLQVSLAAQAKTPKLHAIQKTIPANRIEDLPEELFLSHLQQHLGVRDLCSLAQVSQKYRQLASTDARWALLYQQSIGNVTDLIREAAILAGSWKNLYRCKTVSDKQADPWLTPCEFELTAVLQRITTEHAVQQQSGGIVFLLDGSGSVSQDDFVAMTGFVSKAAATVSSVISDLKLGVMQFSNDIQIEAPITQYDAESFAAVIKDMARMNGGTNVALAIQTASKHMLNSLPETGSRTLILLTDGRIDHYQGREAVAAARSLAEEQANVSMYAFGVGSGVDRLELDKIVAATGCSDLDCRYMPLAVHPESLW